MRCCGCLGQNRVSITSAVAAVRAPLWLSRTCGAAVGGGGGGAAAKTGAGGSAATGGGGGVTGGVAGVADGKLILTAGAGVGGALAGGALAGLLIRTTGAGGATESGTLTLLGGAGGGVGGTAGTSTLFARGGGGGAISVAGAVQVGGGADTVGETDKATGPLTFPNCSRTASLMRGDRSTPHSGHANVTGLRTISGEASNAYFAPQSQMIFMLGQGFGFSSTTFVPSGNAMAAVAGEDFMPPSQNRNVPPYL